MQDTWPSPSIWSKQPRLLDKVDRVSSRNLERLLFVPRNMRVGSQFGLEHLQQAAVERKLIQRKTLKLRHYNPMNLHIYHRTCGSLSIGYNYLEWHLPKSWWRVLCALVAAIDPETGNCLPTIAKLPGRARDVQRALTCLRNLGVIAGWRTRHGTAYSIKATGIVNIDEQLDDCYQSAESRARGWWVDGKWCGPGPITKSWGTENMKRWRKEPGVMIRAARRGSTPRLKLQSKLGTTATSINTPKTVTNQSYTAAWQRRLEGVAVVVGWDGVCDVKEFLAEHGLYSPVYDLILIRDQKEQRNRNRQYSGKQYEMTEEDVLACATPELGREESEDLGSECQDTNIVVDCVGPSNVYAMGPTNGVPMANIHLKLPPGVLEQNPELATTLSKPPSGVWGDVLTALVEVPIELGEFSPDHQAKRAKHLKSYYGLTDEEAALHAHNENLNNGPYYAPGELEKVRAEAQVFIYGHERAFIDEAKSPTERAKRLAKVAQACKERHDAVQDEAEVEYRAWRVALLREWQKQAHEQYCPRIEEALAAWFATANVSVDEEGVPTLSAPKNITLDYCEKQAAVLGKGPCPVKAAGLNESQRRTAIAAGILGAYCLEAQRVGLPQEFRVRVDLRTLHKNIMAFIEMRSSLQSRGWEETADIVLSCCPIWMKFRLSNKINLTSENLFLRYETFWRVIEQCLVVIQGGQG